MYEIYKKLTKIFRKIIQKQKKNRHFLLLNGASGAEPLW